MAALSAQIGMVMFYVLAWFLIGLITAVAIISYGWYNHDRVVTIEDLLVMLGFALMGPFLPILWISITFYSWYDKNRNTVLFSRRKKISGAD